MTETTAARDYRDIWRDAECARGLLQNDAAGIDHLDDEDRAWCAAALEAEKADRARAIGHALQHDAVAALKGRHQ